MNTLKYNSPVGPLYLGATDKGLARLSYTPSLNGELPEKSPAAQAHLTQTKKELDLYFKGDLKKFSVKLDLNQVNSPIQKEVLKELKKTGYGNRTTYGELANRIGSPRASRAVGSALAKNPIAIILPCHRVLSKTGKGSGYAGGMDKKDKLLALENS